ncbi:hypothetical protein [Leptolyngbya sp. BL0902]|uniref:hypothetical protein n=1 Tax=Leptolyngbya sp. BL0902 TaxID=1115757 RepID=UPI0018E744A7|nr:hypothetical protein [Leptolyngbya sp. BL0902]
MWSHLAVTFSLSMVSLGSGWLMPEVLPQHIGLAATTPQTNLVASIQGTSSTPRFTVTYPDHWFEYSNNQRDYVIIYNQRTSGAYRETAPPYLIKTDASIQSTSLREALQVYRDQPGRARRIEEVVINGRLAVRVWEDSEGWAFPNVLITYIPTGEAEVFTIASYYSRQNQYAEAAILQVHASVQLR